MIHSTNRSLLLSAIVVMLAVTIQPAQAQTGGGRQTTAGGGGGGAGAAGGGMAGGGTTGTAIGPVAGSVGDSNVIGRSADRVFGDIGGQTAGGRGTTGARLGGGGGGLGAAMGGFGGLGGFGLNAFGGTSSQATPSVRTQLRSAIALPPQTQIQQSMALNQRIIRSPAQRRYPTLNVSVVDGTAVLEGVVPSDSDRRMAELLLRLEPGVNRIDNQIVVAQ